MNDDIEEKEIMDRRNASPVSGHDSDPERERSRELIQAVLAGSSELDSQEESKDDITPLNAVQLKCSLP